LEREAPNSKFNRNVPEDDVSDIVLSDDSDEENKKKDN